MNFGGSAHLVTGYIMSGKINFLRREKFKYFSQKKITPLLSGIFKPLGKHFPLAGN